GHVLLQSLMILPIQFGDGRSGHILMFVKALWTIKNSRSEALSKEENGMMTLVMSGKDSETSEESLNRVKNLVFENLEPKEDFEDWKSKKWQCFYLPERSPKITSLT